MTSTETTLAAKMPDENMKSFDNLLGRFGQILDSAALTLVIIATLVSVMQVFFRYVLNASLAWPEELAQYLFVWAVFLGMATLTGKNGHISVNFFENSSAGLKRAVSLFSKYAVALASTILLVEGWGYVGKSLQTTAALQWPLKYLFLAVPAGAILNLVFLLQNRSSGFLATIIAILLGVGTYFAISFTGGFVGPDQNTIVLLAGSLTLVLMGVPIAFTFVIGVYLALLPLGGQMVILLPQNMSASLNTFLLLAIPFYVLAAGMMNASGITSRLMGVATDFVGHLRSGLGQANVLTNVLLAGVSGSSTADASAVSKLMVPEMSKRGYPAAFGCAVTSASATLANLIPPGLGLIVYAALASVSVGALFVATIVPGLLVAATLALVVYLVSRLKGYGEDLEKATAEQKLKSFVVAIPALFLPLVIIGGVRFGVFTATEAGAMAAIFALFCGVIFYRVRDAKSYIKAAGEAVNDTVAVVMVIAAASPFAWVLAFEQVPQTVSSMLLNLTESTIVALLIINLFLLFVGLFMEMIAAMVILVPILVPVMLKLGVDPIQFGIILILNLVIGALTPPLGVLVFTTARVTGTSPLSVFRAIVPFVIAMIGVLLVITFVPAVSLLPLQFFGP